MNEDVICGDALACARVMQETIYLHLIRLTRSHAYPLKPARPTPIKTVSLRTSAALSRIKQIAFSIVDVHRVRRGSDASHVSVANYGIWFFSVKEASHITKCFPNHTLLRMFVLQNKDTCIWYVALYVPSCIQSTFAKI